MKGFIAGYLLLALAMPTAVAQLSEPGMSERLWIGKGSSLSCAIRPLGIDSLPGYANTAVEGSKAELCKLVAQLPVVNTCLVVDATTRRDCVADPAVKETLLIQGPTSVPNGEARSSLTAQVRTFDVKTLAAAVRLIQGNLEPNAQPLEGESASRKDLTLLPSAHPGRNRTGPSGERIIPSCSSELTANFAGSLAAVLKPWATFQADVSCSGVWIDDSTLLTAAHCVDPGRYRAWSIDAERNRRIGLTTNPQVAVPMACKVPDNYSGQSARGVTTPRRCDRINERCAYDIAVCTPDRELIGDRRASEGEALPRQTPDFAPRNRVHPIGPDRPTLLIAGFGESSLSSDSPADPVLCVAATKARQLPHMLTDGADQPRHLVTTAEHFGAAFDSAASNAYAAAGDSGGPVIAERMVRGASGNWTVEHRLHGIIVGYNPAAGVTYYLDLADRRFCGFLKDAGIEGFACGEPMPVSVTAPKSARPANAAGR